MSRKRTSITNARVDEGVIRRLGDIISPYTVAGLESVLRGTRELREQRDSADTPSEYELELQEIIQAGGAWRLDNVSVTDARQVYTTLGAVPTSDLTFVQDASEISFYITPPKNLMSGEPTLSVSAGPGGVSFEVIAPQQSVEELFDRVYDELLATVPQPAPGENVALPERPFRVFIAYGGGRAWEVVRDYLRAAGFRVDAFTEQERAGELTLDVVEQMIRSASVAVIVMTGADRMEGGAIHARQNVVHEAGFAQGAIGRRNTIILREADVTLPTNVDGLTYIQFERGEIHTTKDRVVSLVSRLQSLS